MPTPLARLLRALGGGRLPPDVLARLPKSVLNCTDPEGPDFDLPVRYALDDLTPVESAKYAVHLDECPFCRELCDQALRADWTELRQLLREGGGPSTSNE